MPKKPCAFSGCYVLLPVGTRYCAKHSHLEKQERNKEFDKRRRQKPWRKWYNSSKWRGPKGRRAKQLEAEPLCELCPKHSRKPATVADHVEPHRGDYNKFWFGKLQSLCSSCHDVIKQREERRSQARGGIQKSDITSAYDRRG